jgi:uncharacterized membrane protein YfcA
MHLEPHIYILLTCVTVVSGFVDAIAGGGGLLTVPAMLAAGLPTLSMLATNKLQSVCGISVACYNFTRAGRVDWRSHRGLIPVVFLGALAGATTIALLSSGLLKLLVPILLIVVAGYVLLSPRMHDEDAHQRLTAGGYAPIASAIGFYDGFFGPGAGSFFVTSLAGLRGYGLTRATAHTKAFNLTSNIAGLLVLMLGGHVLWLLGLCMAMGSMTGAWIGTHTALRFGAKVIRPLLVVISLTLTCRLLWSYFNGG